MKKTAQYSLVFLVLVFFSACRQKEEFVLVSGDFAKSICLLPDEPEHVLLAVEDLINDIAKITSQRPELTRDPQLCDKGCVIIGSMDIPGSAAFLNDNFKEAKGQSGKWEAYKVKNQGKNLMITGSDSRGTQFGIYHFIEKYLEVDPLYFWTDREPEKRNQLVWSAIEIDQESPSFKYRGWFINDEDLLTGWKESGGERNIDYPFYAEVVNPAVMEKAVEAMIRLRYNLIIPASFIDIFNKPERKLVEIAAKRGVFLSMHHIEPLGVSAFTYFNYWNERGKDLKFSFYSHPEALKEIWKVYAEEWAQFPNVIWQIGLRGIADRPMWLADDAIPQSDAARGELISQAMQVQMDIIRNVDKREHIPVTTTLWMEGSELNEKGYLTFPEGMMVVFSDNSPGWMMQPDFFQTQREEDREYGIYYHHQLWGMGPHLAQAVPPSKTYEIIKQAVEKGSDDYVIFNVSNIREFALGLRASSEMTYDFNGFDPEMFMKNWAEVRFGEDSEAVAAVYQQFFDSYQMHDQSNGPILLDGQIRIKGFGLLSSLKEQLSDPKKFNLGKLVFNQSDPAETAPWLKKHLTDSRSGNISVDELISKLDLQQRNFLHTQNSLDDIISKMDDSKRPFLEVNLKSQLDIIHGLGEWLDGITKAILAEEVGDRENTILYLQSALKGFETIRSGKALSSKGEKWQDWYQGETKMNLIRMESYTEEILQLAKSLSLDTKNQ
ncbi:glycosyl hydrolase 115 family protein [Aquiflexum sp.]|uniref:glycosyl hydrolase 115 family protein n=1 Tax=Aquiflexum sp. TaxID=1872584 RepID=UPI003593C2C7